MRRWLVQSRSLTPAEQDYCRTTALLDSEKSNPRRNHKTPHPPTGNTTAQSHTPNRKKGNNNYLITLPPTTTTTHSAKISNKRASGSRNKDTPLLLSFFKKLNCQRDQKHHTPPPSAPLTTQTPGETNGINTGVTVASTVKLGPAPLTANSSYLARQYPQHEHT
jgi:hypothetical protein